jgi:soluble lytic murein transglycosylase-like protein
MASDYTREQILDIVERQAQASGIPREDFLRFAYIETGGRFNPDASNPSGAKGLFQFMPGTAAQYGIAGREFDPVASTQAAAELYRDTQRTGSVPGPPAGRGGLRVHPECDRDR